MILNLFLIALVISGFNCKEDWSKDRDRERWYENAELTINKALNRKPNGNIAKNVILFLGDGMGISTVTAGRIRKGQQQNRNGEEEITNMEKLDYSAFSKTYNINAQTPDSAGTATAFMSGVKTRSGAIGVDGYAVDCPTTLEHKVESIVQWAYYAGKSTGIVTTTRITHATPAGGYASVPNRDWEAHDGSSFTDRLREQGCKDIALQLIEDHSYINVIMGGGRNKFLRREDDDYLVARKGERTDGRNLIDEWKTKMSNTNLKHKFLWNKTDFDNLNPNDAYDRVLGLFNYDHMDYEIDRVAINPPREPSLTEMTEKAIRVLSKNPKGFFLLVEGGKIDHGHHASTAKRALDDYVEFDNAIGKAREILSLEDTLIVVSADHSHVFTIGGYGGRGQNLFGIVESVSGRISLSRSRLTYTPLLYGNGPGHYNDNEVRKVNLTNNITEGRSYRQESAVPLSSETHGAEDVAIYAGGPMSYIFQGTVEQSYIAHAMAYSACIGPYNATKYPSCSKNRGVIFEEPNSSTKIKANYIIIVLFLGYYLL